MAVENKNKKSAARKPICIQVKKNKKKSGISGNK
jgi:hypothetical protein